MKRQHWPNFDILRLFLAMEVVWAHAASSAGASAGFVLAPPVATFVALSGFLIPKSLEGSRNWGHFAWKRFLRVAPAFGLSLILVAAICGSQALPGVLVYYVTMGFVGTAINGNAVLWSLMLEEVLYTAHAGLRRLWNGRTALGTAAVLSLLSMGVWLTTRDMETARKAGIAASFFAGNAMYFYRDWLRDADPWRLAGWSAPFLLLWWAVGQTVWTPAAPVACAFVLLAWRLPQVRLEKVPDFSYGVYVYHLPILRLVKEQAGPMGAWPLFALVTLGTAAIAVPSWYFMEKPALRLKDWVPRRATPEPVPA